MALREGVRRPALTLVRSGPAEARSSRSGSLAALTPASAYERFAPYVAAIATRLIAREDELEDIVHEVFVAALPGMKTLREPEAFKAWLATITVRTCTRRLRRHRLRRWLRLELARTYEGVADPSLSGEERAAVSHIYRQLEQVAAADRVAWVLRHVEGRSAEEVAELTGCSLATAKRRIARTEDRVRGWIVNG